MDLFHIPMDPDRRHDPFGDDCLSCTSQPAGSMPYSSASQPLFDFLYAKIKRKQGTCQLTNENFVKESVKKIQYSFRLHLIPPF
jgi:hypothetical protein